MQHSIADEALPQPEASPTDRARLAALHAYGFQLEWQPVACVRTGQSSGFEAVLRWDRPGHGAVAPSVLMGGAESAGLATAIDRWMLDVACCAAAAWAIPHQIGVALSPASFRQPDLPAVVGRALGEGGLDTVRLSGSLIRAAGRDRGDDAVAAAALLLANSLGQRVGATGVETGGDHASLLQHGCDEMQDALVGRPAPAPDDPHLHRVPVGAAGLELAHGADADPLGAVRGIMLAVLVSGSLWFGLRQMIGLVV